MRLLFKMQLMANALAALALILKPSQTKQVERALNEALLDAHPDWDMAEVHRLMKKYDERTLRKLYLTPGGYNALNEHRRIHEGAVPFAACEYKPEVKKVADVEDPDPTSRKNKNIRS